MKYMKDNKNSILIKTSNGFQPFGGIKKTIHDNYFQIEFDDNTSICCSLNHFFWNDSKQDYVSASDTVVGDILSGKRVKEKVYKDGPIELFDVVNVENHEYLTNDIISHNCHFISTKGTLVNSKVIESIETVKPVHNKEDVELFVEDLENRKVIVGVDVSEGIGQDYHTIQIFDIDTFEQVGEYRNNILSQTEFSKKFISILRMLWDEGVSEIYYGIENNGVSAGVISLILNTNDKALDRAIPVSNDPKKFGISTTSKTKIDGCMKFKDLLETHNITLYSERLVNELRFFVKKGSSFAAEQGATDDLVMACVICMNIVNQLKYEEDRIYDRVATLDQVNNQDDEDDAPMPIIF